MYETLFGIAALLTALAVILAIASSIFAIFVRAPHTKSQIRLAMILSFGLTFYFLGMAMFFQQRSLPVLDAEGTIDTVRVSAVGKGHRTDFTIARADGATFHLNANGRNHYFRHGQHVIVTYHGYSGTVITAHFINASGVEEGAFQSGPGTLPYPIILAGLVILGFALKKRSPGSGLVPAFSAQ